MNRATDQPGPNPLREGLSTRAVPQPCAIVIFGATGDLTHRKLIPALYNLAADGELPPSVTIVGFARRKKSDDEFRSDLEEATRKFSRQAVRDEIWKTFAQSIFYHQSEFGDESGYKRLAKRLDEIDKDHGTRAARLMQRAVMRNGRISRVSGFVSKLVPPLGAWTEWRDMRAVAPRSFREEWRDGRARAGRLRARDGGVSHAREADHPVPRREGWTRGQRQAFPGSRGRRRPGSARRSL